MVGFMVLDASMSCYNRQC